MAEIMSLLFTDIMQRCEKIKPTVGLEIIESTPAPITWNPVFVIDPMRATTFMSTFYIKLNDL